MPHIGNYLGSMGFALDLMKKEEFQKSYLFIADGHALTGLFSSQKWDAENFQDQVYFLAASWLACGLDPKKTSFYRQSFVPEIYELCWYLSCVCPKGLMNRAHAYKAQTQEGKDPDKKVGLGLYLYPVLMASDILIFDATHVPVGEDQLQHLEMARDLAQKFNHRFGPLLKVPEPKVDKQKKLILGLDGKKMSKSYENTIGLFEKPEKLKKLIGKIKTDSKGVNEKKSTQDSVLFDLYKEFASSEEIQVLKDKYEKGVGWGEVKNLLFEKMNEKLTPLRDSYESWIKRKKDLEEILQEGEERARDQAQKTLDRVKKALGLKGF